jgi:hypothetical protein
MIFWAILLLTCGYALIRGGKYERLAAGLFLTASILSAIDHLTLGVRYQNLDIGEAVVDSAVLVSVVAIALLSDRFWPLWVAGLQVVDSTAHLLKIMSGDLPLWAYAVAERFWSYPILLILFFGTWRQPPVAHCAERRWTKPARRLSGGNVASQEVTPESRHAEPPAPVGQACGRRGARQFGAQGAPCLGDARCGNVHAVP